MKATSAPSRYAQPPTLQQRIGWAVNAMNRLDTSPDDELADAVLRLNAEVDRLRRAGQARA